MPQLSFRCLPPRYGGLAEFHPQLRGPNIIPGLLVLALSIPLGIGAAQRGDGPERPQDELLIPHLSLQGAMPCADSEKGSNRPVGMDS